MMRPQDPLSQYPGYIEYANSNPCVSLSNLETLPSDTSDVRYHALVSASTIQSANTSYYKSGGCQSQIQSCYNSGSTSTCSKAQSYCNNEILSPLVGPYDVYFVLARDPDSYPPSLSTYLGNTTLMSTIGAESEWQETSYTVYDNFADTGDWMTNSRPHLETVINAGVRTIVYDGDAVWAV